MVNLPGNFKLGLQNIRELCHLTVCIEFLAKYSDDEHVLVTSEENLIKVNDFLKSYKKRLKILRKKSRWLIRPMSSNNR